jgi:ABC-type lipoprotein release transport system permease subunit
VQLPGALNRGVRGCAHRGAAIGVSLMPAARASRVDVLQALRSE